MNFKIQFAFGLIVGILITFVFSHFFAPRYHIINEEGRVVKQDRWSGKSWQLIGEHWEAIDEVARDWKEIDQALREALKISGHQGENEDALKLLKDQYPILNAISDTDLNERIKIVYSKEILRNLFLSNFYQMQKQAPATAH